MERVGFWQCSRKEFVHWGTGKGGVFFFQTVKATVGSELTFIMGMFTERERDRQRERERGREKRKKGSYNQSV